MPSCSTETEYYNSDNSDSVNNYENSWIEWNDQREIEWSDFHKAPTSSDTFDATTNTRIGFKLDSNVRGYLLRVVALFHTDSSYVISDNPSEQLLTHERGHFDLMEVRARELRKEMLLWDGQFSFASYAKTSFDSIKYHSVELQDQYDVETDHGRIASKQEEWNMKIDTLLNELIQYSDPRLFVPYK